MQHSTHRLIVKIALLSVIIGSLYYMARIAPPEISTEQEAGARISAPTLAE